MTANKINKTNINLENYYRETKEKLDCYIQEIFGAKTSFITLNFLKYFDCNEENIDLNDMIDNYADENTANSDKDILNWFADNDTGADYVNEIVNNELTEDDDISIIKIIKSAMTRVLRDALVLAYDGMLKECMVAEYLIKSGYTSIKIEILYHMTAHLRRFDHITFKDLFNNALNDFGYDTYNCGAKFQ